MSVDDRQGAQASEPLTEQQKLNQEYANLCAHIGDSHFKISQMERAIKSSMARLDEIVIQVKAIQQAAAASNVPRELPRIQLK